MAKRIKTIKATPILLTILIVVIVAAFIITLLIFKPLPQGKTIDVNGNAELEKQATIATIYLGYQNTNENAQEAEQENAKAIAEIKKALIDKGLSESKIVTDSYTLHPEYEWIQGTRKIKGYRAYHRLKIKIENYTNIGIFITAAVDAGANFVDNIQYSLSDEEMNELKEETLQKASENAKTKAESIAQGLGLDIKGIKNVQDTTWDYRPWIYAVDYRAKAIGGEGGEIETPASVEIGKVTVTASVRVVFEAV
ncbi:MAG: SIMPL domain-containing protein [Candidatus Pacearchaeota archaeon]|nr:MAG: SIMPL domain-containing protein [Candidatus Pacearchaeota archaeon]